MFTQPADIKNWMFFNVNFCHKQIKLTLFAIIILCLLTISSMTSQLITNDITCGICDSNSYKMIGGTDFKQITDLLRWLNMFCWQTVFCGVNPQNQDELKLRHILHTCMWLSMTSYILKESYVSPRPYLNLQSVVRCRGVSSLPAASDISSIQEHTANQLWGSRDGLGGCNGEGWKQDWRWREAGLMVWRSRYCK